MAESFARVAVADRTTVGGRGSRRALTRTRTRPSAPTADPGKTPSTIGRYRIRRRLGHGGMSVVYEAFDERLDRYVALKLLLLDDQGGDRERLRREAQALAQLTHENVVEVYEIGEHEGKAFITMELIEGHALDRWLRLRRRKTAEIVEQFIQAAQGLIAAHSAGLVHRDFKPGNVLVGTDGRIRVVDFGLVRESAEVRDAEASQPGSPVLGEASSSSSGESSSDRSVSDRSVSDRSATDRSSSDDTSSGKSSSNRPSAGDSSPLAMRQTWARNLTRTGAMVGTPAYMSPEQLSSAPVGPASDQFSFCVALYEALDDHHPFVIDDNWPQLPYNVLDGNVQPLRGRRKLSAPLMRVLTRGLSLRPEDRWPSMQVLLEQLRVAMERRGSRTPVWMGGGAVLVASALAIGPLSAEPSDDRCEEAAATMKQAYDASRRKELRRAWLGSRLPGAVDAWERAEPRLDTYVSDWWEAHRGACEQRPPVISTASCLQRLARELEINAGVIEDPNDAMVRNLVPMVSQLSSPDRCTQQQGPTEDSSIESSLWYAELKQINAYINAGQLEEAMPLIDALMTRAHTESNPRLLAQVSMAQGQVQHLSNRFEAASRSFEDAYLGAKQYGLGTLSASAAIQLLRLHGNSLYSAPDAERWASHARAEVERLGDPMVEAMYLNAAGRALRSKGDLEGALRLHEQAIALQREQLSADDPHLGISLFQIGSCLGLLGRGPEGLDVLQQALSIYQTSLGPRHPWVAGVLNNIGVFLTEIGREEEALASYHEAADILNNSYSGSPLYLRFAYINISAIQAHRGQFDKAAETLGEYRQRYLDAVAEEDFDHPHFERVTCELLQYQRKFEEAVPHCERTVEGMIESRGDHNFQATLAITMLAKTYASVGRFDAAMEQAKRSERLIREQVLDPMNLILNFEIQLEIHSALGQYEQSQAVAEERQRTIEKARGKNNPVVAESDVIMALLDLELNRPQDARARLQQARAIIIEQLGPDDRRMIGVLAAEAELERRAGNRTVAEERARAAIELAQRLDSHGRYVADALFTLAQIVGSEVRGQDQARSLAQRARDELVYKGQFNRIQRERIDAWLSRGSGRVEVTGSSGS